MLWVGRGTEEKRENDTPTRPEPKKTVTRSSSAYRVQFVAPGCDCVENLTPFFVSVFVFLSCFCPICFAWVHNVILPPCRGLQIWSVVRSRIFFFSCVRLEYDLFLRVSIGVVCTCNTMQSWSGGGPTVPAGNTGAL